MREAIRSDPDALRLSQLLVQEAPPNEDDMRWAQQMLVEAFYSLGSAVSGFSRSWRLSDVEWVYHAGDHFHAAVGWTAPRK